MSLSTLFRATASRGVLAALTAFVISALPPSASAVIFGPPVVQNDFITSPPGGVSNPVSVAVGDFNGDGHPDIAVVNHDSGILMIFTSNSVGTLTPQHQYGIFNLVHPNWVTAADVNGDGKLDLIVSDLTGISVLLGQGDLTASFVAASPQRPAFPASISPGAGRSVVRDINSDGRPDIVVMRVDAGNPIEADESHLTVLLGLGGGHFGPPDDYDLDGSSEDTSSLVLANFDADLQPDVVFGSDTKAYFMKGNGNGTFQSPVQVIDTGTVGIDGAQAIDIDGDGKMDYLMSQGGAVVWSKGNGNGTFQAPLLVFSGGNGLLFGDLALPVVGDFNHDGLPDFAVAGHFYVQQPNHTFLYSGQVGWGDTAILASLDLNNDLRSDLITAGPGPNQIASFLTIAGAATHVVITGGDNQSTTFSTPFASPLSIKVLDANNNGVPNLQVAFSGFPNGILAAGANTSPGIVFTDSLGNATDTATANNTLGCYPVNIVVQGFLQVPATFNLCNTGSDVLTVTTGNNQGTLINTAFPTALQVKLTDSGNNPKPGVTITFKAPAANASAALSIPATTDVNGLASVNATANGITGPFDVLVSAPNGAQASFQLSNSGPPSAAAQIIVAGLSSPQSAVINTNTFFPLSVKVVDSSLNAVVGAVVAYTVQPDPLTGAASSLDFGTATTDGSGNAQVLATANGLVGSYTVKVTVQGSAGVTPQAISLRNFATLPKFIALISGSPQSTPLNTAFSQKLRVRLTDPQGNPAPQVAVFFIPPANGAGATLSASSALTDANGFAEVTATGNGTAGSYTVSATVFQTEIETPITASFDLTNTAAPVIATVPTLSQWGLVLLALLLCGMSLRVLRRSC